MDPADPIRQALINQGTMIRQHDQIIRALFESTQTPAASVMEVS